MTGCLLPLPQWWRLDGRLSCSRPAAEAVCEAQGRVWCPSAAAIDRPQVVQTTRWWPERGYDVIKRIVVRERHILIATNELVLTAQLRAADPPDQDGGERRLWAEKLQ
jgi:hypothetical protein